MPPQRPLRVGIDISRTLGEPSGVSRYAAGLVRGLAAIDRENDYLLYPQFPGCSPSDHRAAWVPPQDNFRLWVSPRPLDDARRRWLRSTHDGLLGGVDVIHSTAYAAPELSRTRLIVSVHDLSFVTHPQLHTEANRSFCLHHLQRAADGTARILVPSLATKRDLQAAYPIADERIALIPYGVGEDFFPVDDPAVIEPVLSRYRIELPYVLCVGTVEPRKNVGTLLRAMAGLPPAANGVRHQLAVVGPSGWLNEATYALVDQLGLQPLVRFTGPVSNAELRVLFSAAGVFVYPSLLEGFGLPVLEAMACGTAVVTSNVSALPEVAGDAALLVPPTDVRALQQAIVAIVNEPDLRYRLQSAGRRRAARFTWEETARQTLAVYRDVAAGE